MNKRSIGSRYEEQAASYLCGLGYQILARNFRAHAGEIDLIARDETCLVFVEVKYRADTRFGSGEFHVDRRKQDTIYKVARFFLMRYFPYHPPVCRFDVIAINGAGQIHQIENAFEGRGT